MKLAELLRMQMSRLIAQLVNAVSDRLILAQITQIVMQDKHVDFKSLEMTIAQWEINAAMILAHQEFPIILLVLSMRNVTAAARSADHLMVLMRALNAHNTKHAVSLSLLYL
jgi:hypothetical protein